MLLFYWSKFNNMWNDYVSPVKDVIIFLLGRSIFVGFYGWTSIGRWNPAFWSWTEQSRKTELSWIDSLDRRMVSVWRIGCWVPRIHTWDSEWWSSSLPIYHKTSRGEKWRTRYVATASLQLIDGGIVGPLDWRDHLLWVSEIQYTAWPPNDRPTAMSQSVWSVLRALSSPPLGSLLSSPRPQPNGTYGSWFHSLSKWQLGTQIVCLVYCFCSNLAMNNQGLKAA